MGKHIVIRKISNNHSSCNCCLSKNNLIELAFTNEHSNSNNIICLCENCLKELKGTLNKEETE